VGVGAFAALAHLTKAAMLPLMAIFLAACGLDAFRAKSKGATERGIVTAVIAGATFLALLSPYLLTNKHVFGHYFYNVNTTFYVWYDDWPHASVGTILHGDGVGWPAMPPDELPSASRYWHEHTIAQIAARVAHGFEDMAVRSYRTFWYLNYLLLYVAFALVVGWERRTQVANVFRRFPSAGFFLVAYALVYLMGTAFYEPVSGTGTTRFLLAHVLPLMFVLSVILTRQGFVTPLTRRFHLLVSALLAFDLLFVIWPRLMTTYGGF
jgi:hypothetical protein